MKHLLPVFLVGSWLRQKALKAMCLIALSWSFFATPSQAQEFDWVIHFGDTSTIRGAGAQDGYHTILADAAGNVYILGQFTQTQDFDPGPGSAIFTAEMDLEGGVVYSNAPNDYFLAKYDAEGRYIWMRQFVHTHGNDPNMALDSNGHIYISMSINRKISFVTPNGRDTLYTSDDGRHTNGVFMKYDTAGNFIWAKMLTGTDIHVSRKPTRVRPVIAVDPGGNVYLAGSYNDSIDFDPSPNNYFLTTAPASNSPHARQEHLFLAKYDTDGNFIWVKDIKHAGNDSAASRYVYDVMVSKTGNVYFTGINDRPADFDPGPNAALIAPDSYNSLNFLAKYDSEGNFLWANSGAVGYTPSSLEEDDLGNVFVIGSFGSRYDFDPGLGTALLDPIGWRDMYISKIDSNGRYIWAKQMGGASASVQAVCISLGKGGSIYIAGILNGLEMDLDPCPSGTATLTTTGSGTNAFITQFDPSGNYLWHGSVDAVSSQGGSSTTSMTLDPSGNLYTVGQFWHFVDFDPDTNVTLLTQATAGQGRYADWYIWKLKFHDTAAPTTVTIQECDSFTLNGIVYTTEGTYSQFLPSANGCEDSTLIFNLVLNDIEQPIITVDAFLLGVHKPYTSYQWLKDGAILPGATGDTLLVTENGDYQVIVTGGQECLDTSAVYRVDNSGIDIPSKATNFIRIYPNPVNDILYIQAAEPVSVLLTDIAGRKLMELQHTRQLPMTGLPAGVYMLQVKNKEGMLQTLKVVKR